MTYLIWRSSSLLPIGYTRRNAGRGMEQAEFNNSGDYQQFDVLDECLYAKREGRTCQ